MPARTHHKLLHIAAGSLFASCSIVGVGFGVAGAEEDDGGDGEQISPPITGLPSVPPDPNEPPTIPSPGGGA